MPTQATWAAAGGHVQLVVGETRLGQHMACHIISDIQVRLDRTKKFKRGKHWQQYG